MTQELSFFDFKRKHGLSHSDIQSITGCSLTISREWANGATVPEYIAQMLHGIDIVIDRIKTENSIYTATDAQHAANIIEKQNKRISELEEMVRNLQPNMELMTKSMGGHPLIGKFTDTRGKYGEPDQ